MVLFLGPDLVGRGLALVTPYPAEVIGEMALFAAGFQGIGAMQAGANKELESGTGATWACHFRYFFSLNHFSLLNGFMILISSLPFVNSEYTHKR